MGKLKVKKAGKLLRRIGKAAIGVAGGVARIVQAIAVVTNALERTTRAAGRDRPQPGPPRRRGAPDLEDREAGEGGGGQAARPAAVPKP